MKEEYEVSLSVLWGSGYPLPRDLRSAGCKFSPLEASAEVEIELQVSTLQEASSGCSSESCSQEPLGEGLHED